MVFHTVPTQYAGPVRVSMSDRQRTRADVAKETFSDTLFFFPATYVFVTIWPVIYLGIVGLGLGLVLMLLMKRKRA